MVGHNSMKKVIKNKDEDLKAFMKSCWENYQSRGDISFLVEAVEAVSYTHLTLPTKA